MARHNIERPARAGGAHDIRSGDHVADASVRMRDVHGDQADECAKQLVDEQQKPPHERAPGAACLALRVDDAQPDHHLADARARDALEDDEVQGGREDAEHDREPETRASPRVDARTELQARTREVGS